MPDPLDPLEALMPELLARRARIDAELGDHAKLIAPLTDLIHARRPPGRRLWRQVLGGTWVKLPRRSLLALAVRRAIRRTDELVAAGDAEGMVEVIWALADAHDELGGVARG
jgi:hypothetical protein